MNADNLNQWKSLEGTQHFFKFLTDRRQTLKDFWAEGAFIENTRASDRALGEIFLINLILELTAEDFTNE
jgi:hypothetical protein